MNEYDIERGVQTILLDEVRPPMDRTVPGVDGQQCTAFGSGGVWNLWFMVNQVTGLSPMPGPVADLPIRKTGENRVELAGWMRVLRVEFAGAQDDESRLYGGVDCGTVGADESGMTVIVEKGVRYWASIVLLRPI